MTDFIWGLGRRKTSVARVQLRPAGTGQATVNGRPLPEYFKTSSLRETALRPLKTLNLSDKYDLFANVHGGGLAGQAGAVMMGLARALLEADPAVEPGLREHGFLSRDPRMKERKKPGQKAARARFQFSKR